MTFTFTLLYCSCNTYAGVQASTHRKCTGCTMGAAGLRGVSWNKVCSVSTASGLLGAWMAPSSQCHSGTRTSPAGRDGQPSTHWASVAADSPSCMRPLGLLVHIVHASMVSTVWWHHFLDPGCMGDSSAFCMEQKLKEWMQAIGQLGCSSFFLNTYVHSPCLPPGLAQVRHSRGQRLWESCAQ